MVGMHVGDQQGGKALDLRDFPVKRSFNGELAQKKTPSKNK
jgi:hypothetical protein